jgi:hypothetical protein
MKLKRLVRFACEKKNTAGYTWTEHKTNTEIGEELNITSVLD